MTTQTHRLPTRSIADRIHAQASAMYADGKSQKEVAKALGVSQSTVGRALRRGADDSGEPSSQPQVLYRMFDQSGRLLYVGISMSPMGRFKHHSDNQPWWTQVDRIELEHFETRDQVMEGERIAVRDEEPMYNIRLSEGRTALSDEALKRLAEAGRKGGVKSATVRRARTLERFAQILGE